MAKRIFIKMLLLGAVALAQVGCVAHLSPGYVEVLTPPPPEARVGVRPVAPAPNYVWAPGYWHWNGARWIWLDGRWIPAREGYFYVAPRWVHHGRGWVYSQGEWRAQVRPAVVGSRVRTNPPPTSVEVRGRSGVEVRGRGAVEVR